MEATLATPQDYLIHDVRFHRLVAAAAGNSILTAIMESLTGALYESRRDNTEQTADLNLTTTMHREIYRAIRSGNARAARTAMERHLSVAEDAQKKETRGKRSSKAK
jgi:GntR family transcriptional repressor for pyruvate dehydrogenase complex